MEAIEKKLPSRTRVGVALDGWTSTYKLAISSVIPDYMDGHYAKREVQLASNEVDRLFFAAFES